ncbi:MAG TPA: U32 family peptidase [Candidatus Sulfobium mesophilum]|nr:U32 family peptidase [Candidatus Sulfobium mesophilum]
MKKPELLAPAGDFEKLKTAIHYGADAVYLGDSRFSLRGKAGNFSEDEMREAIRYARERGVRVYVTVNIFPHNRDLPDVLNHLEFLDDVRPDAVILSDPGLFALLSERAPAIDVHISTQANVTNARAAKFWERLGARRVVLSRELSIEEIREIRKETTLELEVFVHGSICLSYSGRCYISSFLASRSANRGECTNSCRWNYVLMEEKRQGEYFPVYEDDRGTYVLSSKDLCMIRHLGILADAGIESFKIEGRMKGINYVAGVVKAYREAIDAIGGPVDSVVEKRWMRELAMFSSRGFTTGMFFGRQADVDYNFDEKSYRMSHELIGVVLEVKGEDAKISLKNRLDTGDHVEFLSPGLEERSFAVEGMRSDDSEYIDSARNEGIIFMKVPEGVRKRDIIRRARNFPALKSQGSGG